MKFRSKSLTGDWLCEACGIKPALQITPLNPKSFRCPKCGGELVFVPDFVPVSDEDGQKLFSELRKKLSHVEN